MWQNWLKRFGLPECRNETHLPITWTSPCSNFETDGQDFSAENIWRGRIIRIVFGFFVNSAPIENLVCVVQIKLPPCDLVHKR